MCQPGTGGEHGRGAEIVDWVDHNGLACLVRGSPTHRAGNTLDLTWTDSPGAQAWVAIEEDVTSDHWPIKGYVPSPSLTCEGPASSLPPKVAEKDYEALRTAVAAWMPKLRPLEDPSTINQYASELVQCLTLAIKAVGSKRCSPPHRAAP